MRDQAQRLDPTVSCYVTIRPNAPSAEYAALGGLSVAQWAEEALLPGADGGHCYAAVATTDHAASSYGLPVVALAESGEAIGPADQVYRHLGYVVVCPSLAPMFGRLREAGYTVAGEAI